VGWLLAGHLRPKCIAPGLGQVHSCSAGLQGLMCSNKALQPTANALPGLFAVELGR
jgi:hypothetical protein